MLMVIFVWIFGTLLHFAYDFFGESPISGVFAPVNESVWEHYKLLFYPILFAVIYVSRGRKILNMAVPALLAVLHSGIMMFGIFYFYTSALGTDAILSVDIANFFISSFVSVCIFKKTEKKKYSMALSATALAMLICITAFICIVPYVGIKLPIFIDFSK